MIEEIIKTGEVSSGILQFEGKVKDDIMSEPGLVYDLILNPDGKVYMKHYYFSSPILLGSIPQEKVNLLTRIGATIKGWKVNEQGDIQLKFENI